MFKRQIISLFVLLAFIMLQAHNLTPHSHLAKHKAEHAHEHHDLDHHHHHSDPSEDNDDDSPFTDFTHQANFEKTVIQPKSTNDALGDLTCQSIDLPLVFRLYFIPQNPPPKLFPIQNQIWVTLYTCSSISRRGPPTFIVEA
jgi:hypothetical protein